MLDKLKSMVTKSNDTEETKKYITEGINGYGEILGYLSIPIEALPKNKMGVKRSNVLTRGDFNEDLYLDKIRDTRLDDINIEPSVTEEDIESLRIETHVMDFGIDLKVEEGIIPSIEDSTKDLNLEVNIQEEEIIKDIPKTEVKEEIPRKVKPPKVEKPVKGEKENKEKKVKKVNKEKTVKPPKLRNEKKVKREMKSRPLKEKKESKSNFFSNLFKPREKEKPKPKSKPKHNKKESKTKENVERNKPKPRIKSKEESIDNIVPPHIEKLINSSTYKVDKTIINKDERVDGGEGR